MRTQHHTIAASASGSPHRSDYTPSEAGAAQLVAMAIVLGVAIIWARLMYVFLRWLFRSRGERL